MQNAAPLYLHETVINGTVGNDSKPTITGLAAKAINHGILHTPYHPIRSHIDRTLSCMNNHQRTQSSSHSKKPTTCSRSLPNLRLWYRLWPILVRSTTPSTHSNECVTVWKDLKLEEISWQFAKTTNYRPVGRTGCLYTKAMTALHGVSIIYKWWSTTVFNSHKWSMATWTKL